MAGVFFLLGLLASPSHGADGTGRAAEKARIDAERSAVQERYASRERECRDRFVVSACLADAKRDRRTALDGLRARQLVIDEASRRERAADRQAAIAAKAREDARRDQARAAHAASAASRPSGTAASAAGSGAPAAPAAVASASAARVAAHAAAPVKPRHKPHLRHDGEHRAAASAAGDARAERIHREAEKRSAFERRQEQAQRHRDEMAARRTLAIGKPPALPLPMPSAASSGAGR